MKILLAACNAKYIHSNLAVFNLKAYAKEYDSQVVLREYTINQLKDDILKDIYRCHPDVVCVSCYIWNITFVRELMQDLRKILPDVPFWAGGPEVSYDAETFLGKNPAFNGVMVGEGEETFLELVKHYVNGSVTLEETRGLVYRKADGALQNNGWRQLMDLSKVPFAYENLENFENRIIYYESSRGCPFSCSYCLSSIDKRVRFRSLPLVKKELAFFLEQKVPQVKFVDRTFNVNHARTKELLRFIKENDNGITNFHFEISADLLDDEEIGLLNSLRPGLVQLEIGVQSTDGQVLTAIHRAVDFDVIVDKVRRIQKGRNVHQHLDLIAGLPYGTLKEFRSSFNDVYSLRPQQFQLGFLKVLKGSEMGRRAEEFGVVRTDRPPYEVLSTDWLSYGEVLKIKGIEEMVEVYYNSWQFARTVELLTEEFEDYFGLYEALADFYEEQGYNGRSHSRMERFLILREFALSLNPTRQAAFDQALLMDLYAREKSKSRPAFAPDLSGRKNEIYEFYKKEAGEHQYLTGDTYEAMNARQLLNQTHLEILSWETEKWYLFDYQKRDPLTGDARIVQIQNI